MTSTTLQPRPPAPAHDVRPCDHEHLTGFCSVEGVGLAYTVPAGMPQLLEDLLDKLPHLLNAARDFAAAHLLVRRNTLWRADDERMLEHGEFASRLAPESVTIASPDFLELSFRDGDLFWGHRVVVAHERGRFTRADITD